MDDQRRPFSAAAFLRSAHYSTFRSHHLLRRGFEHPVFALPYSPAHLLVEIERMARMEFCDVCVARALPAELALQNRGDERAVRARLASWPSFFYNPPSPN